MSKNNIVSVAVKQRSFKLSTGATMFCPQELSEQAVIYPKNGMEDIIPPQFSNGNENHYKGEIYSDFSTQNLNPGKEYDAILVDNKKEYPVKIKRDKAESKNQKVNFYIKLV